MKKNAAVRDSDKLSATHASSLNPPCAKKFRAFSCVATDEPQNTWVCLICPVLISDANQLEGVLFKLQVAMIITLHDLYLAALHTRFDHRAGIIALGWNLQRPAHTVRTKR